MQLADGHDICADALLRHQLQDGEAGIGLDREADAGVESGQRFLQLVDALANRSRRVNIQRRSLTSREGRQIDAFERLSGRGGLVFLHASSAKSGDPTSGSPKGRRAGAQKL